jgi:hypothetical protein
VLCQGPVASTVIPTHSHIHAIFRSEIGPLHSTAARGIILPSKRMRSTVHIAASLTHAHLQEQSVHGVIKGRNCITTTRSNRREIVALCQNLVIYGFRMKSSSLNPCTYFELHPDAKHIESKMWSNFRQLKQIYHACG